MGNTPSPGLSWRFVHPRRLESAVSTQPTLLLPGLMTEVLCQLTIPKSGVSEDTHWAVALLALGKAAQVCKEWRELVYGPDPWCLLLRRFSCREHPQSPLRSQYAMVVFVEEVEAELKLLAGILDQGVQQSQMSKLLSRSAAVLDAVGQAVDSEIEFSCGEMMCQLSSEASCTAKSLAKSMNLFGSWKIDLFPGLTVATLIKAFLPYCAACERLPPNVSLLSVAQSGLDAFTPILGAQPTAEELFAELSNSAEALAKLEGISAKPLPWEVLSDVNPVCAQAARRVLEAVLSIANSPTHTHSDSVPKADVVAVLDLVRAGVCAYTTLTLEDNQFSELVQDQQEELLHQMPRRDVAAGLVLLASMCANETVPPIRSRLDHQLQGLECAVGIARDYLHSGATANCIASAAQVQQAIESFDATLFDCLFQSRLHLIQVMDVLAQTQKHLESMNCAKRGCNVQ